LYLPQIHDLQEDIATATANSEDTSDLEDQLEALRDQMQEDIQDIVANYKQQTTQARETWQNEANIRKGGNASSQTTSQTHSTSTPS